MMIGSSNVQMLRMFKKDNDFKNRVNRAHQASRSLVKTHQKLRPTKENSYFLKYKQLPRRKKKASSIAVGAHEHLKDHPEKGPQVSTPHAAHATHTHTAAYKPHTAHCTHQT